MPVDRPHELSRPLGRPPRSAAERAAQRARLGDGCMSGIRAHGPDVSMEQMAAMAGVTKPVLYAEFGDRNGVAEHLAAEFGERIEREVVAALNGNGGPDHEAALRVLIDALFDLVSEEPEIYAFMIRALRSSGSGLLDNALVAAISQRVSLLWQVVGLQLDEDAERVSTHAVLGLVFATLDSWWTRSRLSCSARSIWSSRARCG
jgi:AcrR family transcriptional regulator